MAYRDLPPSGTPVSAHNLNILPIIVQFGLVPISSGPTNVRYGSTNSGPTGFSTSIPVQMGLVLCEYLVDSNDQ